jgi:pheromone shutdown protein TraB
MTRLPDSLSIALWIVGACWAVAVIAYLTDSEMASVAPLMAIGAITGMTEWLVRRQK